MDGMPWTISEDLDEFDRAAGPLLREQSAHNTVVLTITQTLRADGPQAFGAEPPLFGPVYTPPGLRRRGYAGALTVAVSRAALDAGADEVVLFTDLANPTSNALYQRLGYRPVEDRIILSFAAAPPAGA